MEQQFLAQHLPNARYEILDCPHGHDGFLIETEALGRMISAFRSGRSGLLGWSQRAGVEMALTLGKLIGMGAGIVCWARRGY